VCTEGPASLPKKRCVGLESIDELRNVFSRSETQFLKKIFYAVEKIFAAHHRAATS